MKNANRRSHFLFLIVWSLLLPACMTFHDIPTDQIGSEVAVGDTLRVTTHEGTVLEFEVTGLGEGFLQGLGTSIPMDDVLTIEKLDWSLMRTIGLVSVGVVLVFVIGTMTVF